jgi:hypothetical protein
VVHARHLDWKRPGAIEAHREGVVPLGPANYDVGPDGRFLAILPSADEIEPDHLNVILNVGDELRRRMPGAR